AYVAGDPVVGAGRVDRDRRRGVVLVVCACDRLGHVAADLLGAAGVAEELEGDRAGRVAGAVLERRRVAQVDGAVGLERVGAAGVGGQRRAELVDDRVLVRVTAGGGPIPVVFLAAYVAGDPVV